MEKAILTILLSVALVSVSWAGGAPSGEEIKVKAENTAQLYSNMWNQVRGPGSSSSNSSASVGDVEGGDAGAIAYIETHSTSKRPRTRIPPLSTIPPYLPYWNHGGWGTLNVYFPNGPASDDSVYERQFDPSNKKDMKELWSILDTINSYDGPWELFVAGVNFLLQPFGAPKYYHHRGKGIEIANSLIRKKRPKCKPLAVFIDSGIDRKEFENKGYAYVGKVSLEGKTERNWDQVYSALVADTLPWDVDILLVSGGMKGVTIGSTTFFPGAGGGYSQTNYSISLFGGKSNGITEGKGEAVVSGEGYRYAPSLLKRRKIPGTLGWVTKLRKERKEVPIEPVGAEEGVTPMKNNNDKKKKTAEVPTIPIKP